MPVIDPDAIARSIDPLAPERVAVAAGREAIRRQVRYLESGASFAVETTLAGNTILRRMEDARRQGFTVHLIFIGTEDVRTNIERIAERVARGGHHVPEIDVRRRFGHSLRNLPRAIELADRVTIIDNSSEQGPREVLAIDLRQITTQARDLPRWVTMYLGPLIERLSDR